MMVFRCSTLVRRAAHGACTVIFMLAMIAAGDAGAQSAVNGVPNAMQGFSQNRDQPIQIEAAELEMRDKKKEATFSGNVKVVQGDTTMTSKTLVVFYDSTPAPTAPAPAANSKAAKSAPMQSATPGPGGSSSIKRLEAKGNVVVTQKDQVVTGETAIFDTKTNLITMLGGIVALSAQAHANQPAPAQSSGTGMPNAMQGFSQNRDKPIQIEAAELEMRDKKKEATFSGNVKVVQGDTTMTSKTLVVFYDSTPAPTAPAPAANSKAAKSAPMQSATPGPGGSSSIRRLEARGNVVVTQKDQVVTGETAVFDTKTNLITMLGGIVLTQGKNVLRGDRLMVDMTTGVSRVESDSGRVQGLFQSSGQGGPLIPGSPPSPIPTGPANSSKSK